ncbi:alpha/beta hydrolase fold domain-containing protein [Actinomadura graeca]|uniref:Alpha/beta hydrolase fold domain-containing protein n=1 Tax=Actinomadura graeca TaxID=2750812 RepID=A0ABX8QR95_9ACTN|nr:alpha/beta hydrolase fold domain-containing protein [Actinomadura graeca]QXJ21180.1 alpha/beta hydrolase fold domain-containing protein [Actinomadura graeca]
MKRLATSLLLAVLVLVSGAVGARAVEVREGTFSYGGHQRQVLDAYWQKSAVPRAGLILVHGGSWNGGGRGGGWADTARWYAGQGLAVFSIDHRFNTDVAWPGPRDDVLAAIAWIKAEAARFDLDPGKLVIMGSQAGGHLAAAAGTFGAGGSTVRGVIGLSAIASPYRSWSGAPYGTSSALRRKIRDNAVILSRCHPAQADEACWSRWADTVAKARVSADDAPVYLLTGEHDSHVTAGHADDLAGALRAKGVAATTEIVAGSRSGGELLTDVTRPKTLAWIKARTSGPAPAAKQAADPPPPARQKTMAAGDPPAARVFPRPAAAAAETAHAYGDHPRQKLDAYYRTGSERRPALVVVHGGHWYEGDKQEWAATARWFAGQGYAVFSINYRLNTDAPWPAQRDDVASAVAWIRQNAAAFSADPNRVVMLGSSAGGHLAVMAGTHGQGSKLLRGVVALSPVADPALGYTTGQTQGATAAQVKLRDNATLLTRCSPEPGSPSCTNQWTDAAARQHAGAGDAPMFLIHSKQDFVPAAHSAQLCAALTKARVACTTETTTGGYHGGALFQVPGLRDKVLTWIKAHD